MKYIIMLNSTLNEAQDYGNWSPGEIQAQMTHMEVIHRELAENGELVTQECLTLPDETWLVRAGDDGQIITDGVFPEAKEFVVGYTIIDVTSADRALAIAARMSMAPGPGGKPAHTVHEVRRVMDQQFALEDLTHGA
jgi:hypothetical protein